LVLKNELSLRPLINLKTDVYMENNDLTYRINGCAIKTFKKLGRGFREYIYCRGLAIELRKANIHFRREKWLDIHYDEYIIGARRADFVCQETILIEVKAMGELTNKDIVQTINNLQVSNLKTGLLMNFGGEQLVFKHIFNNQYQPNQKWMPLPPELVDEPNDDLWQLRNYIPDWLVQKMQFDKLKQKK
jgi:GxxExxY protein